MEMPVHSPTIEIKNFINGALDYFTSLTASDGEGGKREG